MTDLDEIVMVAKLAWALKECKDLNDQPMRAWFYFSRVGVDLRDYIPGLRERLDCKALTSETHRRQLMETKTLHAQPDDREIGKLQPSDPHWRDRA